MCSFYWKASDKFLWSCILGHASRLHILWIPLIFSALLLYVRENLRALPDYLCDSWLFCFTPSLGFRHFPEKVLCLGFLRKVGCLFWYCWLFSAEFDRQIEFPRYLNYCFLKAGGLVGKKKGKQISVFVQKLRFLEEAASWVASIGRVFVGACAWQIWSGLRCQNECDKKMGCLREIKRMPVTRRLSFVRVEVHSWVWREGC